MLTLFLSTFAILCPTHAQTPTVPQAGRYTVGIDLSYFETDANFLAEGGTSQDLPGGAGFTHGNALFQFGYDWNRNWRSYAGTNVGYAESRSGTTSDDTTRTQVGLSDVFAGGQYWTRLGSVLLGPQVDFVYPVFRPDESADEALIGEGALTLRAGGWGYLRFQQFRPFIFAGYEYRDGGRSHLLPYRVGLEFHPTSEFYLQAEYRGYKSVTDDSDSNNRTPRDAYLVRVNGGSFRFYSVDPRLSEVALEGGYTFGVIGFKVGASMPLNGASAADGWTGLIGLEYSPERQRSRGHESDGESGGRGGFRIRGEKYDESLFREDERPKRSPPRHSKPKPVHKPRPKPNLEQMLDETQLDLER
ncbi:MAG: hypothetical protein AB7G93_21360 [Bdellovibrionales bacterium]